MLVNKIICPKCGSSLTSKAGVPVGAAIACPKCKERFKVTAPPVPKSAAADDFDFVGGDKDEAPAPRKAAPKPPVKPTAKRVVDDDDDEEEERPRKRRPVDEDDDEKERPKARKRRRNEGDEDDDDDRPRKRRGKRREERSAYAKIKGNVWVRVSVLGVLLITLGVVVYLKFFKKEGSSSSSSPDSTAKTNEDDPSKPIRPDQLKKKDSSGDDRTRIQATWEPTSITVDGMKLPDAALGQFVMTISADRMVLTAKPDDPNKYTLDPSKSPKEIDMVDPKTGTEKGIYRFPDKDSLEICMTPAGGPRPTEFGAPAGSGRIHLVFRRGK